MYTLIVHIIVTLFFRPPPLAKRKMYEIVTIIRIFEKMIFFQKTVTIICAGSSEKASKP